MFNLTSYVAESTCDGILFERKIEDVTSDLPDLFKNYFIRYQKKMLGQLQIYIISMRTEVNLADNYRRNIINESATFFNFL